MAADGEDGAGQGEARAGRGSADEDAQLRRTRLRATGMALQLGSTVVGSLLVFLGGGIWLDRRLGTSPWFLLIGLLVAFVAIGYALYELATIGTGRRGRGRATAANRTGRTPPGPSGADDRTTH
jgi:F0F1-type ATP synthase assembly protein I